MHINKMNPHPSTL